MRENELKLLSAVKRNVLSPITEKKKKNKDSLDFKYNWLQVVKKCHLASVSPSLSSSFLGNGFA